MAETKTVTLDVNSNLDQTTKSVGSLKSQLREAQNEVAALSDKFGATSREAVEAAKRAGELKDRIGDAKALTEAFNPDAKFKAVTASLTGVAGGFSAITGSMALLGTESDETEKMILKVQSAMAIASGLQAIGESADAFKNMKTVAVDAFKSIKAAIGGTGIGLLVIALGTLITYWDDISKAIGGATEETKAYDEASKAVNETLTKTYQDIDTVNIAFTNAKRGIISKTEALKIYNDKLGNALGKTDDLNVAEQRMIDNTEKYIKAQIARATAQTFIAKAAEEQAKGATGEATNLSWWQKTKLIYAAAIDLNLAAKVADNELTANKTENQKKINFYSDLALKENAKADKITTEINAAGINKRYDDNKKSYEDLAKLKKDADLKAEEERKKAAFEEFKSHKEDIGLPTDINTTELQNLDTANQAKRDLIKSNNEQILDIQQQFELQNAQIIYDSEEAQKARRKEAFDRKLEDFQNVANAVGSIAKSGEDVLASIQDIGIAKGKAGQTAMKALALVQIGVDSAVAFSKMMAGTEASAAGAASLAGPAAPATYLATKIAFYASGSATILANIAKAKKLLSGGGDTGGGSAPSGGGAPSAPSAPTFNVVGNGGANQIAGVMANKEMPPIKTYVVAGDVTTQQGLNMNIKNNATIG
jgi:hypothetical protein